ncbi:hypothetical protein MUK42_37796 [Musa troglodytarum]|uniref:Uncharacterized protein n=1 Tax=Musa troglodytarum TaxID=320322 RepID=A0A9E7EF33_9LILI|nr:hypothetical protein MUK42_37796 [Musa troglodytarum]
MADKILASSAATVAVDGDKEEKAYKQDSADGEEEMAFEEAIDGGEEETAYKEAAVDVEEDTADEEAAATAGDRDAAVELLEEIRALKDERSDLQRERANLLRDLSDARTKLAGAESDLKAVAGQASRLEGELRIIQDDLSTANIVSMEQEEKVRRLEGELRIAQDGLSTAHIAAMEQEEKVRRLEGELRIAQDDLSTAHSAAVEQEEKVRRLESELRITQDGLSTANIAATEHEENVRRLNSSIKDVEAKFKVKISDLETTVKVLEEELRVSKQKERDEAEKFAAVEEELMTKIAELRSKLEIDKEEKKAFEIDGKVDAGVLPVHFQALRTSAMIGIVALAAGSVVCLQLAKRRPYAQLFFHGFVSGDSWTRSDSVIFPHFPALSSSNWLQINMMSCSEIFPISLSLSAAIRSPAVIFLLSTHSAVLRFLFSILSSVRYKKALATARVLTSSHTDANSLPFIVKKV